MFDVDRDGVLSREEIREMVAALLEVWKDNRTDFIPVRAQLSSSCRWPWSCLHFDIIARYVLDKAQIYGFTLFHFLQELSISVTDIVEDILKTHDTTKVWIHHILLLFLLFILANAIFCWIVPNK